MSKSKLSLGIYSIPPPLVSPWYILPPPGKWDAAAVEGFLETKSYLPAKSFEACKSGLWSTPYYALYPLIRAY